MNFNFKLFLLLLLLVAGTSSCDKPQPDSVQISEKLTDFVDPFIGTANHGHVYPGATVPFGMIQLSPDNGTQGWDWCSGYNWADSMIVGFSHTHLSGTGIGDLYDISMMPLVEALDFSKQEAPKESPYASTFSHDNENASPGYYSVKLDNGINVELTATERVGFHHYTFPEGKNARFMIDLGFAINWDSPIETHLNIDKDQTLITGYRFSKGWAKDQRVYFAAKCSSPIAVFEMADSTSLKKDVNEISGRFLRAQVDFGAIKDLKLKVGLSSASLEGAIAALDEIPDWNFEKVKDSALQKWENELSKIRVESSDEILKRTFYTALYRTGMAPVIMSDAQGNYKGLDGKNHQAKNFTKYDIFSLWDTFRAANPLHTLTQKDKINDYVQSMLAHYDQYRLLPVWSLLGNETNTMTGYHAVPVIVDAFLKGYKDYDVEKAFEAVKASAMQDIRGTDFYREYGYIPYDKEGQSVTKTLEYAYDDWCIAQMAKALGKEEDYQTFTKRAESYKAMFDASTGFMRAKYSDGKWKKPFDPQYSDHNFDVAEYTEGNAWQHSWFVPQDPAGLIELHGGNEAFITKLDSLFSISSEIRGDNASSDISGLIGQYAHGNEPSHHIAYFYNYAGKPWKTQDLVRDIMASQYNDTPTGLCGNEDCGQMSAWYVFSAMGMYPVNPAQGIYVFGSPLFEKTELNLEGQDSFSIMAKNVSDTNKYIQSVTLNGKKYNKTYITHETLMSGGELNFEMGATPNKNWGTDENAFPPSMVLR